MPGMRERQQGGRHGGRGLELSRDQAGENRGGPGGPSRRHLSVDFTLGGPSASAEVEIMVVDAEDEAEIIAMAMSALHAALQAWACATAERRIDDGRVTPS